MRPRGSKRERVRKSESKSASESARGVGVWEGVGLWMRLYTQDLKIRASLTQNFLCRSTEVIVDTTYDAHWTHHLLQSLHYVFVAYIHMRIHVYIYKCICSIICGVSDEWI